MTSERGADDSMGEALFWDIAEELQAADPAISEGTIMSSRCLRADGAFLAMPDHRSGALVVKLPRERVREFVASGVGQPFAPAGRVFKEWVAIAAPDEALWRSLLAEAAAFVTP